MFNFSLTRSHRLKRFIASESGAFTVDWVVLIAGLVALSFAVMLVVSGGVENGSNDLSQSLANAEPAEDPFLDNTTFTSTNDITVE